MKIKVSELKSFKSNASFIKQTNILPILGYLKFDEGCITKSNMGCFLTQEVEGMDESFLVDEKILMNFIEFSAAPEIKITKKDKMVTITDGNSKVTCQTDDIINYPKHEKEFNDAVVLDNDTMCAIQIASNFIMTDPQQPFKSHVFIGKGNVAGSNGFIAYISTLSNPVPEIILSKDTAAAVGRLHIASYATAGRWDVFKADKCTYGFIKPELPFFDLSVFGVYDKSEQSFVVNKTDFIRFNDMCLSSTPTKNIIASFQIQEGELKLDMKDSDYDVSVSKGLSTSGEMEGSFKFMPYNMNQLLKSIPSSDITFTKGKDRYIISDEGYTTLITKIEELKN